MRDLHQLAPPVAFFHLPIDQSCCHLPLPYFAPSANYMEPLSEMGRQGIEVQIEAIAGEEREAAKKQEAM